MSAIIAAEIGIGEPRNVFCFRPRKTDHYFQANTAQKILVFATCNQIVVDGVVASDNSAAIDAGAIRGNARAADREPERAPANSM
jgi:hypothetical protein